MKIDLGKRPQRQAEEIDAWWAENRPAAPALFAIELRETLEYIRTTSNAGIEWPTPRRPALRRILMPRTQNHVYFYVDERRGMVHVIAVWGAPKGRTPRW